MAEPQILLGKERNEGRIIQHYQVMKDGELKVNSSGLEFQDESQYQFQLTLVGQSIGEELRYMGAIGYQIVNGKMFDPETKDFTELEEFNSLEIVALTQAIKITGGLLVSKVA